MDHAHEPNGNYADSYHYKSCAIISLRQCPRTSCGLPACIAKSKPHSLWDSLCACPNHINDPLPVFVDCRYREGHRQLRRLSGRCVLRAFTSSRQSTQVGPTAAREGKIRSAAAPLAVDPYNMTGLRLPSCQAAERVVVSRLGMATRARPRAEGLDTLSHFGAHQEAGRSDRTLLFGQREVQAWR